MQRVMSVPNVILIVAWNDLHPLMVTCVYFGHCLELQFSPLSGRYLMYPPCLWSYSPLMCHL